MECETLHYRPCTADEKPTVQSVHVADARNLPFFPTNVNAVGPRQLLLQDQRHRHVF